nr:hypothetical protein GCM10020241_54990 [Streptoalloteichus tenebrarius]
MTNTALPTTPPPPSGPVVCGQVPVPATGGQATVIADAGPGGPVPCADALRIVRTYLREAPSRGQGSAGVLDVEGWECATASMGSTTPGRATCRKDGRSVHTGQ